MYSRYIYSVGTEELTTTGHQCRESSRKNYTRGLPNHFNKCVQSGDNVAGGVESLTRGRKAEGLGGSGWRSPRTSCERIKSAFIVNV